MALLCFQGILKLCFVEYRFTGHWMLIHTRDALWDTTPTVTSIMYAFLVFVSYQDKAQGWTFVGGSDNVVCYAMQVEYEDGDEEDLIFSNENVKFYISRDEMESLNLSRSLKNVDSDVSDYNELVVLAASLDDCQELEPGDIVWAKLTGT